MDNMTAKAMAGQSKEERIRALEACVRELREAIPYPRFDPTTVKAITRSLGLVPEKGE